MNELTDDIVRGAENNRKAQETRKVPLGMIGSLGIMGKIETINNN